MFRVTVKGGGEAQTVDECRSQLHSHTCGQNTDTIIDYKLSKLLLIGPVKFKFYFFYMY